MGRDLASLVNSRPGGGAKYLFKLQTLKMWCPWYEQALATWQSRLGTSEAAAYAVACRMHDVDKSTMANYGPKWRQFVDFCDSEGFVALPATPCTVATYVGWMARKGSVRASSMGQYLACISKAHRHCDLPTPSSLGGDLISSTVSGMARLQRTAYEEDEVLYLPAPYVALCADWAASVMAAVQGLDMGMLDSLAKRLLSEFRDAVAVVFNFCDFGRADSQHHMKDRDVDVDPAGQVLFRLRHVKRRSGRLGNLIFQWPADAFVDVVQLLQVYRALRRSLGCSQTDRMWVFPWDLSSVAPNTTGKFDLMVKRALLRQGVAPPAGGFKYSSRSIRAGAASASASIDVPLPKIRFLGGWSPDSAVPERVYIDPTCPPTPAAVRFFGWLRRRASQFDVVDTVPGQPPRHQV